MQWGGSAVKTLTEIVYRESVFFVLHKKSMGISFRTIIIIGVGTYT